MDNLAAIRRKPNQTLIESLEKALEQAKTGDLQGMFWIDYWDTDMTTHGWALPDKYKNWKATLLIGEMHKAILDLGNCVNEAVKESEEG